MLHLALALALVAEPSEPADAARLARGEVLVTLHPAPPDEIAAATARGVVDAPPARVFALVSDCANYQRTLPGIRSSEEVSTTRAPDGTTVRVCKVTAKLPFPFHDLTSVTRGVHTVEGGRYRRAWTLVEGDYQRNQGYWLVEPYGPDGQRSLVTYELDARPRVSLPASVVARAQHQKLKEFVENLRAAVRQP